MKTAFLLLMLGMSAWGQGKSCPSPLIITAGVLDGASFNIADLEKRCYGSVVKVLPGGSSKNVVINGEHIPDNPPPSKACKSLDEVRIDGRCWYRVKMEHVINLEAGTVSRVKVPDSWLVPQGAKGNTCPTDYDYQHMESTTFYYSRCIPKERP